MMDASLPADESGLSDLSAASITSIGQQYIGPPSPTIDTHPTVAPTTPMPSTLRNDTHPYTNATPRPSRINPDKTDKSGAAWTPSPDASSSRSRNSNTSILRPPSRNGNESMGSSLGTFDYSNASFSESFLRQAGAHMLAGLDEAHLPPAASSSTSSPRYRTSSSPTVTAKPIRPADPTTPFTGKSLRTRMAEAGVIDSPASSDGSSPATSPTAHMLPDSYTRPLSYQPHVDQSSPQSQLDSPQAERSSPAYSPSVHRIRYESTSSPLRHASPVADNSAGMEGQGDWQEGLSMVPEESYVEGASQLPSTPMGGEGAPHHSVVLDDHSSHADQRDSSLEPVTDVPSFSPAPEQRSVAGDDASSSNPTPASEQTPAPDSASSPVPSSETKPEQDSDASSSRGINARSRQASPRSSPPPRAVNTPRSFARLRVGTPVRSSPLSRVVNFSPASSASGASQWQSPVSQRGQDEVQKSSPRSAGKDASPMKEPPAPMSPASFQSLGTSGEEHGSHPQTPSGIASAQHAATTPSHLWSPATSAAFATPASQRPHPSSAPATPASSQPFTPKHPASLAFESSSPADFGTPQWSPSAAASTSRIEPVQDDVRPEASIKHPLEAEEEEAASSSACSSASGASEKKRSGDVSTSSLQPAVDSSSHKEEPLDLSLVSTTQHDSPSAARFSRMQLSRIPLPNPELAGVPELNLVASAFDSLTRISDSRVSRLVAQLSAATARIDELEAALEARDCEQLELQQVRRALEEVSGVYREVVGEVEQKEGVIEGLVKMLQGQVRGGGEGVVELERKLEEERRLREVERRDFEVRLQVLKNSSNTAAAVVPKEAGLEESAASGDDKVQIAIERAKEQLRATLEKDFDVRRAMEQRQLRSRIESLESQLASSSSDTSSQSDTDLHRQISQLTADLDRRFEELADLRDELESTSAQRDRAEERISVLDEELAQAQSAPEQLQEEVEELRSDLAEREAQVGRVEETLQLTRSRLASLEVEREMLEQKHEELVERCGEKEERVGVLEGHVLKLERELRSRTPVKAAPAASTETTDTADTADTNEAQAATTDTATTPTPATRIAQLERQLATLQLDLFKLNKANDALQQDNINFSIALSAKQLELGMVKRNARFAFKNAHAHKVGQPQDVGLPKSKVLNEKVEGVAKVVEFPKVPEGEFGKPQEEKENVEVNQARVQARQMLALRRAAVGGLDGGGGNGQALRRQRQMMAA